MSADSGGRMIDVPRRSIEETAAAILRLYSERQASPGKDPQGASLL